jgi:transcriptional regulator with XRE-family HTH domain
MSTKNQEQIVKNLQRIWNVRKKEMEITQVEAAKKLNWTQGAFSQYLNAITEMSPHTVIKIANFLDVTPQEIDPNIDSALPNVESKEVRFNIDSPNLEFCKTVNWDTKLNDFCVKINKNTWITVDNGLGPAWQMFEGMLLTCVDMLKKENDYIPRMSSNAVFYLVQEKGSSEFVLFTEKRVPANSKLDKKFLVTDMWMY